MALAFRRKLAIPLWAIAFVAIVLTTPPPAALFLMPTAALFAVGIALAFLMLAGASSWLRMSRSLARVLPSTHQDRTSAAIAMAAATRVCLLDETNRRTADDVLDFARMDDDGGWQLKR